MSRRLAVGCAVVLALTVSTPAHAGVRGGLKKVGQVVVSGGRCVAKVVTSKPALVTYRVVYHVGIFVLTLVEAL